MTKKHETCTVLLESHPQKKRITEVKKGNLGVNIDIITAFASQDIDKCKPNINGKKKNREKVAAAGDQVFFVYYQGKIFIKNLRNHIVFEREYKDFYGKLNNFTSENLVLQTYTAKIDGTKQITGFELGKRLDRKSTFILWFESDFILQEIRENTPRIVAESNQPQPSPGQQPPDSPDNQFYHLGSFSSQLQYQHYGSHAIQGQVTAMLPQPLLQGSENQEGEGGEREEIQIPQFYNQGQTFFTAPQQEIMYSQQTSQIPQFFNQEQPGTLLQQVPPLFNQGQPAPITPQQQQLEVENFQYCGQEQGMVEVPQNSMSINEPFCFSPQDDSFDSFDHFI